MPVELTREELKEAIAEGMRRAISDLFAGIDLADAVQQGVRAAFDGHDIEAAVKQGVGDSFPWPSETQLAGMSCLTVVAIAGSVEPCRSSIGVCRTWPGTSVSNYFALP